MKREENQDSLGRIPIDANGTPPVKGHLFIIADGMGGHAGGKQASSLAVETIEKSYSSDFGESVEESLKHAFKEANRAIYDFSINHPQFSGMGTTCIALAIKGNVGSFAHVGDSRLYRISGRTIEQITQDHTKVAELVRHGVITEGEAETHPERSMLMRAMGVRRDLSFDLVVGIDVEANDQFLMCTDGLSNLVSKQEMVDICLSHPPQGSCDLLVDLANSRGGHDNITVQIVLVKGQESFLKKILR
jgi:PPM family protein phosphatase